MIPNVHVLFGMENSVELDKKNNAVYIIVDVIRAGTMMICSLAAGAKGVYAVPDIETVWLLKDRIGNCILAGERDYKKVTGFDHGNSPREILENSVSQKYVVLTTSNGTRIIHNVGKAEHILIGGFLNASAVSETAYALAKQKNLDIVLLACGPIEECEDWLAAGFIASKLGNAGCNLDEDAQLAAESYERTKNTLNKIIKNSVEGAKLRRLGYEEDIDLCLQIDRYILVPKVLFKEPNTYLFQDVADERS
ncbi:MAG: 2-phosphosulfolactate phosphatase [Promethearchaeota archaeon]